MRVLLLLALVLWAIKKLGESVLSFFCALLFGYAAYLWVRALPKPGFLCRVPTSRVALHQSPCVAEATFGRRVGLETIEV